ncbi:hypothetical protein KCP74_16225 [Salmonella enterica subsp. enterica]|nr:hypothetical protein KCP74_16225 [Salmonella enterica subsp. enterica]
MLPYWLKIARLVSVLAMLSMPSFGQTLCKACSYQDYGKTAARSAADRPRDARGFIPSVNG